MSAVVRMAFQDGESAVKLFQQHYAGQFVRQSDLAKGKNLIGGSTRGGAPAVGGTYGKQQLLRAARLVILEEVRDLLRSELEAARVEQHQHWRRARAALFHQLQQRGFR